MIPLTHLLSAVPCGAHASYICDVPLSHVASPRREQSQEDKEEGGRILQPPAPSFPPNSALCLEPAAQGCEPLGRHVGRGIPTRGRFRSNSSREIAFPWSRLTRSLTPADSRKIHAAGSVRARGARERAPASIASTRHPGSCPGGPPQHAWPRLHHCTWERHRPFRIAVM